MCGSVSIALSRAQAKRRPGGPNRSGSPLTMRSARRWNEQVAKHPRICTSVPEVGVTIFR